MSGIRLSQFEQLHPGQDVRTVAKTGRVNALQDLTAHLVGGGTVTQTGGGQRILGPGYQVVKSKNSSVPITLKPSFPWKIRVAFDDGNNPYVVLKPGTLNNMIPTNMFNQFSISSGTTWYVILHAETDGYRPTTCEIRVDTSPGAPSDVQLNLAPNNFDVNLGVIVNLTRFQLVDGLLFATPDVAIYTLTESPAPGRPLYDNNYTWFIEQF